MDKPGKEEKAGWKKLVPAWSTVLVLGMIAFGCAAIATPKFKSSRERANTRACYANQKTLVGAIEMYNLDRAPKKGSPFPIETTEDLAKHYRTLRSGGYLQSIPDDPGEGRETSGHYLLTGSGNGIRCTVHGSIQ